MRSVYTRRAVLQSVAALAAAELLRSQDGPAPTFPSNVKVVNLYATVRNEKGEIVRNLTKEDFVLEEDGRPQQVTYFSRETDLPLTLGFVVDTSISTRKVLPEERTAARTFIDQVLRDGKDQGFLIHFDREVELLRDLTNSRPKLQKALDLLQAQVPERSEERQGDDPDSRGSGGGGGGGMGGRPGGGGMGWPGGGGGGGWPGAGGGGGGRRGGGYPRGGSTGHRGGGSHLYDAILLASDEIMKKEKGRKALIVLSDGQDSGSKTTLRSAVSSAQHSDSMIYTVFIKGESGSSGRHQQEERPDGKHVMEQLAGETGASMIAVTNKTAADSAFSQIGEELHSQYSLGYSSDNKSNDGGFRKIVLTAKHAGLTVHTRDGYWADGE